jgi:hypothetical protein
MLVFRKMAGGGSGASRAYIIYMQTAVQRNLFRCTAIALVYSYVSFYKITPPSYGVRGHSGSTYGMCVTEAGVHLKLFIRSSQFIRVYTPGERTVLS